MQRTGSLQLAPDSLPKQDNSPTVIEKLDLPLIYSLKVIEPGSRKEFKISSVVYKGADTVVAATSDGHVSMFVVGGLPMH